MPPVRSTLSVVVPTRNEALNVETLVSRLGAALNELGKDWELLFVDDSDDRTPEVVRGLSGLAFPVRLMHREPGERAGGLGGAVQRGFAEARGGVIVVMDGDLQHPPEVLPALVAPVLSGDVESRSREPLRVGREQRWVERAVAAPGVAGQLLAGPLPCRAQPPAGGPAERLVRVPPLCHRRRAAPSGGLQDPARGSRCGATGVRPGTSRSPSRHATPAASKASVAVGLVFFRHLGRLVLKRGAGRGRRTGGAAGTAGASMGIAALPPARTVAG